MSTVIETKRLRLRNLSLADASFMLELMNEPAFIKNVADRGLRTIADAATFLSDRIIPSYNEFGFGFYLIALKEIGTPIGICGLIKRKELNDPDIGYSLLERFWGNGYAFESAEAVMDYAYNTLRLPRIAAITAPHNRASIKLLEKLGMSYQKMVHLTSYRRESMLFHHVRHL